MSALRQKTLWLLGEVHETAGYAEALAAFQDLELEYRGPLSLQALEMHPRFPDLALVCGESCRIDPLARLLAGGTDLWIESPIAANPDDASALAALAEAGDRTLMSGTPIGWAPVWRRAKSQIREGSLGTLRRLEWRTPIKAAGRQIQALEPRSLLCALEIFESFAGSIEALRISWDSEGRGASLQTRHADGIEGHARFLDGSNTSASSYLTCRGDRGELWIGDGQSILHGADGATRIAGGIEPAAAFGCIVRELLKRRLRPFVEDRGAWLLRGVTDALLHADRWRPA